MAGVARRACGRASQPPSNEFLIAHFPGIHVWLIILSQSNCKNLAGGDNKSETDIRAISNAVDDGKKGFPARFENENSTGSARGSMDAYFYWPEQGSKWDDLFFPLPARVLPFRLNGPGGRAALTWNYVFSLRGASRDALGFVQSCTLRGRAN